MQLIKIILPASVNNFFTKGDIRSVKAKKNIVLSFILKGATIAINLILVPMTIDYVNPTQYGIWLTLSSIIAWFGFFDIGFGNGLRNKFTEAIANGKYKLARIYVSTTYAILFIIITVVLVLFCCINPFLNWTLILNTPISMAKELNSLAVIVFVFFCMQFVLQLITTIITANQQPAKATLLNFIGNLFSIVAIYILTKTTSGNILYLGLCLSSIPVVVLAIASLWLYKSDYKNIAPSLKFVKFSIAKNLMRLGMNFFIIQIAAIVLFQTNNIIISQLFGPEDVTSFNIAVKYFNVITMIYSIITTPLWSAFTDAWIKGDIAWIKSSVRKMQKVWYLIVMLTILMFLSSNYIYSLWVGKYIKISYSISFFIALNVIVIGWNTIYVQFINGVGKIKLQLYSGIFGIILNIPLSLYFGKKYGVIGIVASSCMLGLINTSWTYLQYKKLINKTAKGIWNK